MALIVEHGNSITITANGYTYAFRCPLAHTAQGAGYIYVLSGWEIRAINIATGVNTNLCYLITKAVDVIKMVVAHNTFILLITQTEWCRYDMINFMWIAGATSRCEDCGGSINQVGYTVTPAGAVESHYTCGTKKTANLYIKNILYAFNDSETTGRIFNNRFVEIIVSAAAYSHRIQFIDIRTGYNYAFPENANVFNIERHCKNTVINSSCKPSNAKCSYDGTYTVLKGQKAIMSLGTLHE
jgi:hypothetical protein